MALGSLICGLSKHVPDEFMVISFRFKSYLLQHKVPFWITVPIRVKKDDKDAFALQQAHFVIYKRYHIGVRAPWFLFYTVYALNTSINISLQRL